MIYQMGAVKFPGMSGNVEFLPMEETNFSSNVREGQEQIDLAREDLAAFRFYPPAWGTNRPVSMYIKQRPKVQN